MLPFPYHHAHAGNTCLFRNASLDSHGGKLSSSVVSRSGTALHFYQLGWNFSRCCRVVVSRLEPVAVDPSESQRPSEQTLHTFCQSYKLTSREEEVLFQLSDNQRIAEIAQVLYISPGTVKAHVHNIYTKTGVKNQEELRQVLSKL